MGVSDHAGELDDIVDGIMAGIIRSCQIDDLQSQDALANAALVGAHDVTPREPYIVTRANTAVIGGTVKMIFGASGSQFLSQRSAANRRLMSALHLARDVHLRAGLHRGQHQHQHSCENSAHGQDR